MPPPDISIRPTDDPVYLLDMALVDENQRNAVTEILKYNYGNEIDYDFFVENPVVEVQTDLLSARMITEELDIPRKNVSVKKRAAKGNMKSVRIYQAEYEEATLNRAQISMTSQEFSNENEKMYETAIIEEIEQISEDLIQSFCDEVGVDVKKEMFSRSFSFVNNLDENQLNHAINEQVKMDVTKENLRKETIENRVPVQEWKNKNMIPTKVKASVVDQITDKALNVLNNIPYMMTLMIQGDNKNQKTEVENVESKATRPKPPGRGGRKLTKTSSTLGDIEEERSSKTKNTKAKMARMKEEADYMYSSSSEDEAKAVGKMIGAITLYDSAKPIDRVDTKSIPIWRHAEGRDEKFLALDDYIEDLTRFSTLGYNVPEPRLIYMSLNASDRMGMLKEFPSEKLEKLDDFIDFLKESYGRSELALRDQLASMKRKPGESTHALLSRVICVYYRSKGMRPRTMAEIIQTELRGTKQVLSYPTEVADLIHYFVTALQNKQVVAQLKMRLHDLCLSEIAAVARDIENALETSTTIFEVNQQSETLDADQLRKDIVKEIAAVVQRKPTNIERCFACQKPGHRVADCWSRNKVAQYPSRANYRGRFERGRTTTQRNFSNRPEKRQMQSHDWNRDRRDNRDYRPRNERRPADKDDRQRITCHRCGLRGHVEKFCRVNLGRPFPKK